MKNQAGMRYAKFHDDRDNLSFSPLVIESSGATKRTGGLVPNVLVLFQSSRHRVKRCN